MLEPQIRLGQIVNLDEILKGISKVDDDKFLIDYLDDLDCYENAYPNAVSSEELSRLKNVRDKWSEANKTISSTGDKTAIARNLKINQGRQGKLTEKSTKRTLSSRELEELTLLKQKELEYLAHENKDALIIISGSFYMIGQVYELMVS